MQKVKCTKENEYFNEAKNLKKQLGNNELKTSPHLEEKLDLNKIQETIDFLMAQNVDYEFRTTVIPKFHNKKDMEEIGVWLRGAKALYLQAFKTSDAVRDKSLTEPNKEDLLSYQSILSEHLDTVLIRGMDV